MQENNSVPTPEVTTPVVLEQPKQSSFLTILLSILLILSISIAAFFAYQTQKLVKELTDLKTQPSPIATVIPEVDSNTNWQTYTSAEHKFTFKYPITWKIKTNDDSKNLVSIVKTLPIGSVDEKYCNANTDCLPEVSLELRTAIKPVGYTNVQESLQQSSVFGEGLSSEKTEYLTSVNTKIRLEYLRNDSLYPSYSYLDLSSEILRIKAWLPSSKNCVGTCPTYTDSTEVINASQEILRILSTFMFLD